MESWRHKTLPLSCVERREVGGQCKDSVYNVSDSYRLYMDTHLLGNRKCNPHSSNWFQGVFNNSRF